MASSLRAAQGPRPWGGSHKAFGENAPDKNIAFPAEDDLFPCHLTAAEIIAFLPHWLKSPDIVTRLFMKGTTASIVRMGNRFLNLPIDPLTNTPFLLDANTVYKSVSNTMRRYGYKNWTTGKHKQLQFENYDEECIWVNGYWTESQMDAYIATGGNNTLRAITAASNAPALQINFRDLATNVASFPQGHDALDLTRCVRFAIDERNKNRDWFFPQDWKTIVTLIRGPNPHPNPVVPENRDDQVFARWGAVQPIVPTPPPVIGTQQGHSGLDGAYDDEFVEEDFDEETIDQFLREPMEEDSEEDFAEDLEGGFANPDLHHDIDSENAEENPEEQFDESPEEQVVENPEQQSDMTPVVRNIRDIDEDYDISE